MTVINKNCLTFFHRQLFSTGVPFFFDSKNQNCLIASQSPHFIVCLQWMTIMRFWLKTLYSSFFVSVGGVGLALAVAPLDPLAFSFLSSLSIRACSFFTNSSSSAWEDKAGNAEINGINSFWWQHYFEQPSNGFAFFRSPFNVTTTSHRKIVNRLHSHLRNLHLLQLLQQLWPWHFVVKAKQTLHCRYSL